VERGLESTIAKLTSFLSESATEATVLAPVWPSCRRAAQGKQRRAAPPGRPPKGSGAHAPGTFCAKGPCRQGGELADNSMVRGNVNRLGDLMLERNRMVQQDPGADDGMPTYPFPVQTAACCREPGICPM